MIELAEVVRELRGELDRARAAAGDEELRFELGPIELEVTVGLVREGGAGAKVRFWVVELGGDARATATSTQRVKLTLQPTLADAAARPYVSGEEKRRER
jgi:hypothetical protein